MADFGSRKAVAPTGTVVFSRALVPGSAPSTSVVIKGNALKAGGQIMIDLGMLAAVGGGFGLGYIKLTFGGQTFSFGHNGPMVQATDGPGGAKIMVSTTAVDFQPDGLVRLGVVNKTSGSQTVWAMNYGPSGSFAFGYYADMTVDTTLDQTLTVDLISATFSQNWIVLLSMRIVNPP